MDATIPESRLALGLMSGTSMDAIDLALIETDGLSHVRRLGAASAAYDEAFRKHLRACLDEALSITDRTQRPGRHGAPSARARPGRLSSSEADPEPLAAWVEQPSRTISGRAGYSQTDARPCRPGMGWRPHAIPSA